MFWPSLGWRRTLSYYRLKLARLSGSPHSIALGFACGAAMAPSPLMGVHLAAAALLALFIGGTEIASPVTWEVVVNPCPYNVH
mgnify:CR=1 FL=1